MLTLVAEHGAIDPLLTFSGSLVDTVISELTPDENGSTAFGSQDKFVSGTDEQFTSPAAGRFFGAVVASVHFKAIKVSVLR